MQDIPLNLATEFSVGLKICISGQLCVDSMLQPATCMAEAAVNSQLVSNAIQIS
jgi:hypothetical protein